LTASLKVNTTLEEIHFNGNNIGHIGTKSMASRRDIHQLSHELKERETKITSLKDEITSLKVDLKRSKPINVVDLTNNNIASTLSKRPRIEKYEVQPKSTLAIQYEQNQKIVQVKEEKVAAEKAMEDAKEDLEDTQEDLGNQVLYVNFLQSKIDELAALAENAGADRAKVAEIRGRLYSNTS